MWRLEAKVYIEKIEENIFKFNFGNHKDKEKIYQIRPWTVNGALLILKEWDAHEALKDIFFHTSIFILQIHGLPPVFLHEGTAEQIGNQIGEVYEQTMNQKICNCKLVHEIQGGDFHQKPYSGRIFPEKTGKGEM